MAFFLQVNQILFVILNVYKLLLKNFLLGIPMSLKHFFLLLTLICFQVCQIAYAQVSGDVNSLETELKSRNDILFFGGFEAGSMDNTSWASTWGIQWIEDYHDITRVNNIESLQNKTARVAYYDVRQSGLSFLTTFRNLGISQSGFETLYLRYYVKFEPGFDFVLGGKLPGLVGGENTVCCTGGNKPNGTDGWTCRLMWQTNGGIVVYAYLPKSPNGKYGKGSFGQDIPFDYNNNGKVRRFVPGQWHCVEEFIQINTVGKEDGKIYAWLDGELAVKRDNVTFRTTDNFNTKIGGLYFSSFFGGSTSEWAPPKRQHIYFDNFVIARNYVGPIGGNSSGNVLPNPTISPNGGRFANSVNANLDSDVSNATVHYTTDGSDPDLNSPEYNRAINITTDTVIKAKVFRGTDETSGIAEASFTVGPEKKFSISSASASVVPEPEHGPEKAIDSKSYFDQDPDSRWAGDTMPEWLQFDLGSVQTVSITRLSFYRWTFGRTYNYSIEISTTGNDWRRIVDRANSVAAEWTENIFSPQPARYVRLIFNSGTNTTWAGVWEGEIWGTSNGDKDPPVPPTNVRVGE